ncbi:hypothetical protein D9M72_279850 [compost metagenome]
MKQAIPPGPRAGSVCANTSASSPPAALATQAFSPSRIQPPPSPRRARVAMAAKSLPARGSDIAVPPTRSPASSPGR